MEGYPQGNFGPYIRVDWSCRYYQGSIFPARQGSRARRLQGVPVYRGPTEKSVKRGKAELKRKLEEIMNQALSLPGSAQQRRYQVISFVWELLEPISCPPKWICFCGVVRYNSFSYQQNISQSE